MGFLQKKHQTASQSENFAVRYLAGTGIFIIRYVTTKSEFIPTRPSLLSRLKDLQDQQSWSEFCALYRKLIYSIAKRSGLNDAESHDVVQEVLIIVSRKIEQFRYNATRGSFKSWLALITRRRIQKQLKKRLPLSTSEESTRTATICRIADSDSFEAAWDDEWNRNLWTLALDRVKASLKPKQFQMFDLYALKEWPIADVARALGVSATHVYVTKHRVAAALHRELLRLTGKSNLKPLKRA